MTKTIIQKHFKRVETKYILTQKQEQAFLADLAQHMEADDFAQSSISNVYFDNPDFQMVADSLAKKHGKEKIRMRLYDLQPTASSQAFLEIKKKVEGIGFKYRLTSNPVSVTNYVLTGLADASIVDDKVTEELHQLRQRYGTLQPKLVIAYDRQSYKGLDDKNVRLTIDRNLIYRDDRLSAYADRSGHALLPADQVIMEVKVAGDQPAWLQELLVKHGLEKASFSKYGQAYKLNQARLAARKEIAHA